MELNNLKIWRRCASRVHANGKNNADCEESKLNVSEKITSDMAAGNKELKKQLDKMTTKNVICSDWFAWSKQN